MSDLEEQFAPTCTVVVCTRDRPSELERCLEALRRLSYPRFEVLVVDNAPRDRRTHEVAARHAVSYVVEPLPGLSRARNRGARASTTEIVAYLDDDALPEPAWLGALTREFKDTAVMAVAGRVRALNREMEAYFSQVSGPEFGGPERLTVDRQSPNWFERANFGGIGIGMNMAFRRHAFAVWHGFDERLGRGTILEGCEEHHAFFRLLDLGYRVVYTPAAVVGHAAPRTLAELRERQHRAIAASAGYATFLLFEEPRYRWDILRYLAGGMRRTARPWRNQGVRAVSPILPYWRLVLLALSSCLLYARARFFQR